MKKILLPLLFPTTLFAWDFNLKTDVQKTFSSNINLTNTSPISDSLTSYGAALLFKTDQMKVKLKGKVEKYAQETTNDNYSGDLTFQFKPNPQFEFIATGFTRIYNGTSLISTDSTGDNSGARATLYFSKNYSMDTSAYFSPSFTFKKYPKLSNRSDKVFSIGSGLESYLTPTFMLNPEFNAEYNSSSDSYYSYLSFGPSLFMSVTLVENLELSLGGSYTQTRYITRSFTQTSGNRNVDKLEYQTLVTTEVGLAYYLFTSWSLQARYSTSNNNSNNKITDLSYKANVTTLNLSYKF